MGVYQYKDGKLNSIAGAENAAQVYYDNTGTTSSATNVQDAITELNTNCNLKQNKTDNTLGTTSKTVVGAINELNNDLSVFSFRNNSGTAQYSMNNGSTWVNFKNPVGTKYIYSNGTYDVTNYASAYVSVSASLSETTLWTNSSPTSSFGQQNVTLSDSISNYRYLKFTFRPDTSTSTEMSVMIETSEFTNTADGNGYFKFMIGGFLNRVGTHRFRPTCYISDSSIKFYEGVGAGQYSSAIIIPTKIAGLK